VVNNLEKSPELDEEHRIREKQYAEQRLCAGNDMVSIDSALETLSEQRLTAIGK
jgi:hypothetical protein